MPVNPPGYYVSDGENFAAPAYGGTKGVLYGSFTYQTAAGARLFTLPPGARLIDCYLEVVTAFNAGTTNLIDIGITGDDDYLYNDAAGGAAAILRYGASGSIKGRMGNHFPEGTNVTVTYAQTGTAASAGAGFFVLEYIMTAP